MKKLMTINIDGVEYSWGQVVTLQEITGRIRSILKEKNIISIKLKPCNRPAQTVRMEVK